MEEEGAGTGRGFLALRLKTRWPKNWRGQRAVTQESLTWETSSQRLHMLNKEEVTPLASWEGVRWLGKAGSQLPGGKWPSVRGWDLTPRQSPWTGRVPTAVIAAG